MDCTGCIYITVYPDTSLHMHTLGCEVWKKKYMTQPSPGTKKYLNRKELTVDTRFRMEANEGEYRSLSPGIEYGTLSLGIKNKPMHVQTGSD